MSTYYDYREVGVMIAHKLMKMEGWKVYGYKADESDSMTDYWSPASWDGVAEKNGYILCVNVYGAEKEKEIKKYNYDGIALDTSITEKIAKLERMTVENGASEAEEASAKASIARLQKKAEENNENKNKYVVIGHIPAHMAHPPRMNWHIEKDGIIIAKGNGVLKYANISDYYNYSHYMEDMEAFKKDRKVYTEKHANDLFNRGYYSSMEKAQAVAEEHAEEMESKLKLINQFEAFINKIDTTCGGLIGDGDGTIYEKITVVEYKKENKAIEDIEGSIKDGQCFILKTNFNYGSHKGLVYRIHEMEYNNGQKYYTAYKLNGKLTKECHGMASSNNNWRCFNEKFLKWIEQGAIAWCHVEEIKTPYEVEKVVKKTVKATKTENDTKDTTKSDTKETDNTDVNNYIYEVSEDTDTRDGSRIYLVKVTEKLSKEEYIKVNNYIKSLGGYYSKFKHAFLFKENPTEKLNATTTEATQEPADARKAGCSIKATG